MNHVEPCNTVKDLEKRVVKLEVADATLFERIDGLVGQLSNLTGWIKTLVISIFTSLIGFFIWYVQNR